MALARPAAGVLVLALAGWGVAFARMPEIDGALAPYVALWVTMTAAMMLPSALPMLVVVEAAGGRVAAFALGYVAVWTSFGIVAYALGRGIGDPGARAGGIALVAAGLYQLSPLKHACLRHCRSPVAFLHRYGRPSSFATGVAHGVFCVGCCAGLMLALFALGLMSVAWMAAVAALILAEKALPHGEQVAIASAVAFVAAGAWLAL